jgi:hypothetical protein
MDANNTNTAASNINTAISHSVIVHPANLNKASKANGRQERC